MSNNFPEISVVIPTRNRGDGVVTALDSVLKNHHPSFEVILVDQSSNQITANAVEPFKHDPRFRYVHSETQGSGLGRNIGLALAKGDIVAFTDDDCSVPGDWLDGIKSILTANPHIAMVFCNVEPGLYDRSKGYVPAAPVAHDRIVRSMRDTSRGLGLGAGMAARRAALIAIGGFDNDLGAGAKFGGGEDRDIAIRVLLDGGWVWISSTVTVTHFGFRTWQEGKAHTKRDFIALGATSIKPIKCGHWNAAVLFVWADLLNAWWGPFSDLLHGKWPQGFGRIIYFGQGVIGGLIARTDRQFVLFRPDETIAALRPATKFAIGQ